MNGDSATPAWYRRGDVPASVRAATTAGVDVEEIVDVLHTREFDAPRRRVQTMVEAKEPATKSTTAVADSIEVEPHDVRYVDETDLGYLVERDLAIVVGVMLCQFGGSYRIVDEADDPPFNLVWMGTHETVGLRTVSLPPGEQAGKAAVRDIVNGDSIPSDVQDPTARCIVSPKGFTEDAVSAAEMNDVRTIGPSDLEMLLRHVRLTPAILGALPEVEELIAEELGELSNAQRRLDQFDPFDLSPLDRFTPTDIDVDRELDRPGTSLGGPSVSNGDGDRETGTLYADPGEDGDAEALERFMQGLEADTE